MLLADIGNTHIHIFDGKEVEHMMHDDALRKYAERPLSYITVKQSLEEKIAALTKWKNISSDIALEGSYETMGVDRRALCLSRRNALLVDAGSAITVDLVEDGVYRGGFILPGIKAMLDSYAGISPLLKYDINKELSLKSLPLTTKDGISYGIIASIKAVIEREKKGRDIYFTGGDGAFLSSLFEGSVFDERLVFQGMLQALGESRFTETIV